jgi:translation initiation factor IF-2
MKNNSTIKPNTSTTTGKQPVVVVMGHIDHGKSTLLDYIRKSNVVDKEVGGITQGISAYEVLHKNEEGKDMAITFLDTPGHAAFQGMRNRGAEVADIAILVVSAEDGVKPQTIEALRAIKDAGISYIVAINKMDKPGADVDRTKLSLAENEIYVEGYGGTIPFVPISAKVGTGVNELLDTILLVAELEGKIAGEENATGIILETSRDPKRGISATLILTSGILNSGDFAVCGRAVAPVRIMENFKGVPIKHAHAGMPIVVVGWSDLPEIGKVVLSTSDKKMVEELSKRQPTLPVAPKSNASITADERPIVPIIIKADAFGSIEAITHEIKKLENDSLAIKVIASGVGSVSENDIKLGGNSDTIIVAFDVKVEQSAKDAAERFGMTIVSFDIIYKLSEWLETIIKERTPKVESEEVIGKMKVLKVFGQTKEKQVVGGKVGVGKITLGGIVKILRRDFEIGSGKITGLQQLKSKATEVLEGNECGIEIQSKTEILAGDSLEAYILVIK